MVTIKLTEQQLRTLTGLIDAGIRATGLAAVVEAASLMAAIEQGVSESKVVPMPGPKAVAD